MSPLFDGISSVLDKVLSFIPNPAEKAKAEIEAKAQLLQMLSDSDKAQDAINQVEAGNSNIFVSGWRPFIGWVCGFSYAWNHLLAQFITYFVTLAGYIAPTLPILVDDNTVLMGMLGLGAMRSWDKMQGTAK